jgi:hypothetical protein
MRKKLRILPITKLSQDMQCHASAAQYEVNKKQLLIAVNCFSLKKPIFNK